MVRRREPSLSKTDKLEELFGSYKDKVFRLARSLTRNEKDAEDIVQNTFVKILQNIGSFKGRAKISTWIYKIAYNEAMQVLRKKYKQINLFDNFDYQEKTVPSGMAVNWPEVPDQQLLDSELKNRIQDAISHLPIQYRMPLLLQRVEGEPLKNMAEIMGMKVNSLKTRLHRAHIFIKEEIEHYLKDKESVLDADDEECSSIKDFVFDYTQGSLEKGRRKGFYRHIKDCRKCHVFLSSYQRAIAITKSLYCKDLPPEFKEKIRSFIFSPETVKKAG